MLDKKRKTDTHKHEHFIMKHIGLTHIYKRMVVD